MKFLSPKTHGILDYMTGVSLLMLPRILNLSEEAAPRASSILRFAGTTILAQAAATDYEMGIVKKLPFRRHLSSDYILASAVALSPAVLGFQNGQNRKSWLPHVLIGLYIFLTTLMTRNETVQKKAQIIHLMKRISQRIS